MSRAPHIVLFDLHTGGHHGQYVRQLVEYWGRHALPGRLDVVVPPPFAEVHADVLPAIDDAPGAALRPLEAPVRIHTRGAGAQVRNNLAQGRLLRRTIERLRPDHVVCLYFDQVQLATATDLRFGFPVALSGIYFRPPFPQAGTTAGGLQARLARLPKRLLLHAALKNPHLKTLFCLDPTVVPALDALSARVRALALPDGVTPLPASRSRAAMQAAWGVAEGRRVALLFGSLGARKGLFQVLDALEQLPPEAQRQLSLVLVGAIAEAEAERVQAALHHAREATAAQILVEDRFVEEEVVQDVLGGADLVLLPYQRHVGSSGVLIRAAHEARPVLGSDYGLLGEYIRRHALGLGVDTTAPRALAAGLAGWLAAPEAFPFEAAAAQRFARAHTADAFAETIFGQIDRLTL